MRQNTLSRDDDQDDEDYEIDEETLGQPSLNDHPNDHLLESTIAQPFSVPSSDLRPPTDSSDSGYRKDSSGEGSDPSDPGIAPGSSQLQFRPDQVLFGKYKLIRPLGAGGMGEVWLVSNQQDLERIRALKLIRPAYANNERWWRRFALEGRLMVKLENHPNAVKIYDYGREPGVGAYIEMHLVKGKSLDKLLEARQGRPMTPEEVAPMLYQLCDLLQEAHGYVNESNDVLTPIIHRDLKPSNLMLVKKEPPDRNLRVLDFGVAKMVGDDGSKALELTGETEYVGTIYYSSPEQLQVGSFLREKAVLDGRSDLYSVGVILYQLLTGSLPFRGRTHGALMVAHASQPPPPMNEVNPAAAVAPAIERVVRRCLEKNPDDRPQSAEELAEEFRKALAEGTPQPKPPNKLLRMLAVLAIVFLAIGLLLKILPKKPNGGDSGGPIVTQKEKKDKPPQTKPRPRPIELPPPFPPKGYTAKDPNDRRGLRPRVLVRTAAGVEFIQIPGKTYLRGDPDQHDAAKDSDDTPWAHWVAVRDFYLQETEVTNGEIEDYLSEHPQDGVPLSTWKQLYERVKDQDKDRCRQYPAVGINYPTAQKYARSVGGRLPTEAEWELAAKSGNDEFLYVWGKKLPQKWRRLAALYDPNRLGARPVKFFEDDKTEQDVFDMVGNVREWCVDDFKKYSEIIPAPGNTLDHPLEDAAPRKPFDPTRKYVVRGGCFEVDLPQELTTFYRHAMDPSVPTEYVGFRVVIECPQAAGPERGVQ